jgi:hypothetical protein
MLSIDDIEQAVVGVLDRPGVSIPLKMQGVAIWFRRQANSLGHRGSYLRDRRVTAKHHRVGDCDCEHAR